MGWNRQRTSSQKKYGDNSNMSTNNDIDLLRYIKNAFLEIRVTVIQLKLSLNLISCFTLCFNVEKLISLNWTFNFDEEVTGYQDT